MKLRNLALLTAASLMVVGLARCGTPVTTNPDTGHNGPPKDASTAQNDTGTADECGNGTIDGTEKCDGTNLDGKTCVTEGFAGGTLTCKSDCTFDLAACTAGVDCGNGAIDGTEQCDGTNLDSKTCQTEGFASGALSCNANCSLNTSACGSGTRDAGTTTKTDSGTAGPKENNDTLCNDGVDNDNNGFTDCDDFSCCKYGVPATGINVCTAGTCGGGTRDAGTTTKTDSGTAGPKENNDTLCNDGVDNDNNGFTDCDDFSCCKYGVPATGINVCTAGTCGGGTRDAGTVAGKDAAAPENTDPLCSDGFDNNGNGYIDCADFTCCRPNADGGLAIRPTGLTVCNEVTCEGPGKGPIENTVALCSDGKDNDGNKKADCNDPNCCRTGTDGGTLPGLACEPVTCAGPGREVTSAATANAECSDGLDNNANGFTDCNDFDCCRNGVPAPGVTTACKNDGTGKCVAGP